MAVERLVRFICSFCGKKEDRLYSPTGSAVDWYEVKLSKLNENGEALVNYPIVKTYAICRACAVEKELL